MPPMSILYLPPEPAKNAVAGPIPSVPPAAAGRA